MFRPRWLLAASFAFVAVGVSSVLAQPLGALQPAPSPPAPPAAALHLAVGAWSVSFSNGVVETCCIGADGSASVVEPLRRSPGRASGSDDSFVISFDDDRTERWTRVGEKMVVEHWCPSSAFPSESRVLGIAQRSAPPDGAAAPMLEWRQVASHRIELPTTAVLTLLVHMLPDADPPTYRIEICLGAVSESGERNIIQEETFRSALDLSQKDAIRIVDLNADEFPDIRIESYRDWVYDRRGARFVFPPGTSSP